MRTNVALIAALCLAVAALPAFAEPKQGAQMTLEQYFAPQPAKKKTAHRRLAKHRKGPIETGSIEPAAPSETVSCKKFDSLIGQTITVPCR